MSLSRAASLVVAFIYLLIAYFEGGGVAFFKTILGLLLPMCCIWFGDEIGLLTGRRPFLNASFITNESPGILVKFMGWILLLLPIMIAIVMFLLVISGQMKYQPIDDEFFNNLISF